jgi:hypothetical protein
VYGEIVDDQAGELAFYKRFATQQYLRVKKYGFI